MSLVSFVVRTGAAVSVLLSLCTAPVHATTDDASTPALPQTAAAWRQAARHDIEEAVELTRENHPGVYDTANPGFLPNLEQARRRALALAERVDGPASYLATIGAFNATLGDGHAGIAPRFDADALLKMRWPGFVTVWREPGMFVVASVPGGPAPGAQVVACDGKPVRQRVEDNVFAFEGRGNEPGRWWSRSRTLFIDAGNPFIQLPQRCRFSKDGKTFEQALAWQPHTDQARAWLKESYNGPVLPVGLSEPRPGMFWAAMPTFAPDEAQREAYRAMVKQVTDERQRLLDADALVIDLRRNQGGSSFWSRTFAGALWGEGRVKRRLDARSANTETWWRASQGNTDYVSGLIQEFIDQQRPESVDWARRNSAGMRAALARGDKYYVEKERVPVVAPADAAKDVSGDPPSFAKPVYVIVPGQCASACLDALDAFTQFSNTILIGAPSSADSTYMEVRTRALGSGLAAVTLPNKMYVHRARANGQAYLPAIYVNDVDWSVDTLRRVVERDLAQRKSAGPNPDARRRGTDLLPVTAALQSSDPPSSPAAPAARSLHPTRPRGRPAG